MASDDAYLGIVEAIYDAATDPALWPMVLEKLAAPSRGKAFMAIRDPAVPAGSWPILYAGMEQGWLDALSRYYGDKVAWITSKVPRRPPGTATPSESVISRSDLLKTEWYNDFLRPQGLISGIGVTVMRERGRFVSAGLLVPLATEARQAEHTALVQRVTPHLERALKVNRQLAGADFRWQAAEQSFDRLSVGVVLVAADRTVQFANAEAERILGQEDGLWRDQVGHLRAAAPDDDQRLLAGVRSAVAGAGPGPGAGGDRGGVLSLRRRSGERPYSVLVGAVRPPSGLFGPGEPNAILFISDRGSRQPSGELLAETFGLTPAESRLLQALLQGQGLTDAAARLGVSVNTAKTHLRALFEKLECSRQADLIQAVISHPVWLAGRDATRAR